MRIAMESFKASHPVAARMSVTVGQVVLGLVG